MQWRGGNNSSCIYRNFYFTSGHSPMTSTLHPDTDTGLANDAPIQGAEGFGHAAQRQVGKDMTPLTKAVSHIPADLNTRVELAVSPCSLQLSLSVWECRVSCSTIHKMYYPIQRN